MATCYSIAIDAAIDAVAALEKFRSLIEKDEEYAPKDAAIQDMISELNGYIYE